MSRTLFCLLLCLVPLGCSYFKPELPKEKTEHRETFLSQPEAERHAIGQPDWGLALSGGGIRSATVVLGALKALYDQQVLDSIDVISSVSGGGYTAYWLYSREYRGPSKPGQRFGAKSFENAPFTQAACEIATTNNFVSNFGAVARWGVGRAPTRTYRAAILRTFGHANYDLPESYRTEKIVQRDTIEFHELRGLVQQGLLPNLIVNSRVYRPRPSLGWADGMYELTPFHRGTAARGFSEWSNTSSYPILDGVSASGAAVAFALNRTLPDSVALDQGVKLSDGGHAENLGVLALVRRRVKNIIVLDAEHDPSLGLQGYTNLKTRLLAWGDTLVIDTLDALAKTDRRWRPERGVFLGKIRSPGYSANVYYMKLSLPMSMNPILRRERGQASLDFAERNRLIDTLKFGPLLGKSEAWDCRTLASQQFDLRSVARYEVQMFLPLKDISSSNIPSSWAKFPHPQTFKNSYNLDRTMAQIGIGYFLGEELAELVRPHFRAQRR